MITIKKIGDITLGISDIPTHDKDGRRRAERCAVTDVIAAVMGRRLELHHRADGAPYIDADLYISVSHSRDLAVVAFGPRRLGVDAETWREALRRVTDRYLSADEQRVFTDDDSLLRAWTIKEAVYKVAGADAYDFASAIAISPDLDSASASGVTYDIHHITHGGDTISVAVVSTSDKK